MSDLSIPLYRIIANSANYGVWRPVEKIKWIVMHYTANDGDTDTGNAKYFAREKVGASAHYFADEDSVTQSVPDDRIAWHCETPGMTLKCGCRNSNSIGVEMCSDVVFGRVVITGDTMKNAAELVRWLMKKYDIPPERVIRHYDVCGKNCPEPWVRDENEWLKFKKMIVGESMEELKKLQTKVDELEKEIKSGREKVFDTVEEVPEWGRETVKKLISKGVLKGDGEKLNLSYTLLRLLVINDRVGLYDKC